jgi:hypothetical protein
VVVGQLLVLGCCKLCMLLMPAACFCWACLTSFLSHYLFYMACSAGGVH